MIKIINKSAYLLIILLAHFLINTSIFAQAPQKMSYQAVIRNSNDSLLIYTPVGMRISLVQGTPTGSVVFSETQTATTNANGLVSIQIGMGTAVSGTFAGINWAAGPYYVKTETDLSGGTNYTITSSNEILSVPYALFSANGTPGPAGPIGLTGETGAQGIQGATGLLSSGAVAGNTAYWNGSVWVVNNSNIHNNGAGVGIGTVNPNTSAKLDVESTTQGFLPPRLTTAQRDVIVNPAVGLIIYNTTTNCLNFYVGSGWNETCGTASLPLGVVSTINCGSATITGTLTIGTAASGVSVIVPYTGGNAGTYGAQSVSSTGVVGLTATLSADSVTVTLANGAGSLIYTITGTPTTSGSASFAITLGGQSCAFTVSVSDTSSTYPAGTVHCAGATTVVDVTNPTTGKIWMDRNLGATQVATSSSDVSSYGDLYQWGRGNDGHQCRNSVITSVLSATDQPTNGNYIVSSTGNLDWRSPQNNNLWQGVNGINNPCPTGYRLPTETEFEAERLSWTSNNANGAFNSVLKLTLGGFRTADSPGAIIQVNSLGGNWTNTIYGGNSKAIAFSAVNSEIGWSNRGTGYSVRCIKDAYVIPATLGAINCGSTSITGTLTSGIAASGVSASVTYTGGNGGSYAAQTISSPGETGLTATLSAGSLANGAGSLIYTITGTPTTSGSASFAITLGEQSCAFTVSVSDTSSTYPAGTVHCTAGATAVVDVTNPTTGKIWMDRNLGATQVATSSTDVNSYGDLYQWGRRADGHQCRTSASTSTLSSIDQPAHGDFIIAQNSPYDWRSPQNANLWQGVNGINNPCPSGYRLPTETELEAERLSWSQNNSVGAFSSLLKLPMAGIRGSISIDLNQAAYWSSTPMGYDSRFLNFSNNHAYVVNPGGNSNLISVRCIKETEGAIGTLNCGGSSTNGILTNGTAASGVSASVPYTGGNGGSYVAQTISSTGVTGLTATLSEGSLANGAGSLIYTITGTPTTSGSASFAITLGGQSCAFTVSVSDTSSTYPAGTVHCAGATTVVDVTNPTTGKIWMDRNLGATQVATSSTDVNSYGDLYQWGRPADGHHCRTSPTTATLSSVDQPAHGNFITINSGNYDWRSPQNANLWQGVNGVNNPCPSGYRIPTYSELEAERLSWGQNTSSGAFASPLKLPMAGNRYNGDGSLNDVGTFGSYWSSGPGSLGLYFYSSSAHMDGSYRALGFSVRCLKDVSLIPATLGAINCGSTSITGTLTSGIAASGVSASVPYTAGNGVSYATQTISSTGVTGLTATLSAGSLANGAGSLIYTITGTPTTSGSASFAITVGGQSCAFTVSVSDTSSTYPAGTVHCTAGATAVVDVTNPTTGKIWMDRNLGATQVATSSTDVNSYGDLYQWGRRADGHQCRTSATTNTLSSIDQPAHGDFIIAQNSSYDWRSPQNANLWQGVNGVNNPCPSGYRLPTETEINAERLSWSQNNSAGAFASPLKLPMAGGRDGSVVRPIDNVGTGSFYWSSSVSGADSTFLLFFSSNAYTSAWGRASGISVRCLKD
jgi:uncharacterized protein (TIGR02145 family)